MAQARRIVFMKFSRKIYPISGRIFLIVASASRKGNCPLFRRAAPLCVSPDTFLGCRGGTRIHLDVNLREGAHHSGNWGGVLANPATILASAIATLVDKQGRLLVDQLKPPRLSNQIRTALAEVKIEPMPGEPALSDNWGEEGLSAAEWLYAWITLVPPI
jgi:hypothetical protein